MSLSPKIRRVLWVAAALFVLLLALGGLDTRVTFFRPGKQVFANALKRVNKEINRLRKFEARTAHVEAARRAFALSRSEKFIEYPADRKTAREGMQPQVIRRRRTAVPRGKIGSVMKATKVAQARRDSRD